MFAINQSGRRKVPGHVGDPALLIEGDLSKRLLPSKKIGSYPNPFFPTGQRHHTSSVPVKTSMTCSSA